MKNKIRLSFQLIILGLLGYLVVRPLVDKSYITDFESYCPFGGIASLGSKLNQGTMSCNMSETQLLLGIGLLIGVVLVGKLFCSYVCPIGSITEWLGKIGDKLHMRFNIHKNLDRPLRSLKYILLFLTLYFTMTSSELFCKEFDPYFAAVNLFDNTDIALYFALPAFAITILGSIFFRLFWCKYLCPLGAFSNIFLNLAGFGTVILAFIIANLLGAELSFVWLMGGLVLMGMLNELIFKKSFFSPFHKIIRDDTNCSDCNLCDTKCPQGIKISQTKIVTDVDCNLCTDCVYSCPLKNIVTVNKKKNLKFLAPVAVVALIAISLGFATQFELETISERWGNSENATAVYRQEGLKNIKCYGSAKSLQGSIENVEGIYGLDAYAKSQSVKIFYDPAIISEKKVKESIFTPTKMEVVKVNEDEINALTVWDVGIYGIFDLIDYNNLFYTLRDAKGVYGFETHFGEPVQVIIFFDNEKIQTDEIKRIIERKEIITKKPTGEEKLQLNFKCADKGKEIGELDIPAYRKRIFRPYDRMFNGYKEYDLQNLDVFIFSMPDAALAPKRRFLGSLSSHLSADDGVVRLSTRYLDEPVGLIFFDPLQTNIEKIKPELVKKELTIFTSETDTKNIENPFKINPNGDVKKASEIKVDDIE